MPPRGASAPDAAPALAEVSAPHLDAGERVVSELPAIDAGDLADAGSAAAAAVPFVPTEPAVEAGDRRSLLLGGLGVCLLVAALIFLLMRRQK
jgi:hypothetical protein